MSVARLVPKTLCCVGFLIGLLPGLAGAQTGELPQAGTSDENVPIIDLRPLLETLEPEEPETSTASDQPVTVPEYARAATATPPSAPNSLLLPLVGDGVGRDRILRLSGEQRTAVLSVDIAAPDTVEAFALYFRNSINVLPGRSELLISVNGTEIAPVTLAAFEGFESVELPRNLLVEGRNEILVSVNQSHRIFCGPEATFQIWTEFDLSQSGVRLSQDSVPTSEESFSIALAAQLALRGSVPVRIAPEGSEPIIRQINLRLSGVGSTGSFIVRPESHYAIADTVPPIARVTVLAGPPEPVRVERGADGALVLVLVLDPADTGAFPDLDSVASGATPVADIGLLQPGVPTSLRDMKFTDTESYNRYSEQRLPFRLPDDWLMLSSAKATLRLTYGFAEGLPEGALMLVKVNETTVRLLPLDTGGGEVLAPLDIGFAANLLNPGPNEINFVTLVPGDPVDLPCPPNENPFLTISEDSTLLVPSTPHMSFVGLRGALTSMRPEQVVSTSGAAREETDQLALALASSLRPIEARTQKDGGRLSVSGSGDFENVPTEWLGLSRRQLEGVLMAATPATEIEEAPSMFQLLPLKAIEEGARAVAAGIVDLAKPGSGPIDSWIEGRHGRALLLLPDPQTPDDLWLVISADSDPVEISETVAAARFSPFGPRGRLSLLTDEGEWQSWQDTSTPPVLREPLTFGNFRAVAGNYASWSPLYFVAILFVFTVSSVMLALIFVISTRGKRKR